MSAPPDELQVSPNRMESAATQLTNDAAEAQAIRDDVAGFGFTLGEPEVGLGVRNALVDLGLAIGDGFDLVRRELDDLSTRVSASASVAVLVDTNATGYFTAADAI